MNLPILMSTSRGYSKNSFICIYIFKCEIFQNFLMRSKNNIKVSAITAYLKKFLFFMIQFNRLRDFPFHSLQFLPRPRFTGYYYNSIVLQQQSQICHSAVAVYHDICGDRLPLHRLEFVHLFFFNIN